MDQGQLDWPLSDRPGFLARRLHQIHVSLFSEHCAVFGITPLQYSLLTALHGLCEADQTTLAHAVALDRTTATGALKRLEARGLISRSVSSTDRRAQLCRMTLLGIAQHRAMQQAVQTAHAETVSPLSAEDQQTLVRLMRQVVDRQAHRTGNPNIA